MNSYLKRSIFSFILLLGIFGFAVSPVASALRPDDPETGGSSTVNQDNGSGSGSSGSTQIEQIEDPALTNTSNCDGNTCNVISNYINPLISLLSVIVGLAVAIGIIFGGIQVATSAGDPQKAASGKDHIRNGIIALIAFAVLYAFISWLLPGGIGGA